MVHKAVFLFWFFRLLMFVCFSLFFLYFFFFLYKIESKYSLIWFGNYDREKKRSSLAAGTILCPCVHIMKSLVITAKIHCSGMPLIWIRLWYLCRVRCFNINGCVNSTSLFILGHPGSWCQSILNYAKYSKVGPALFVSLGNDCGTKTSLDT